MVIKSFFPGRILAGMLTFSVILLFHTARAATIQVHVGAGGGLSFTPDPVNIAPGDTVQWIWDFGGHSVTSGTPTLPDGMFDTGLQAAGFMFPFTFNNPGTFPYFCTRHGAMMTGTVNVAAPSPSPSASPSPVSISGTVVYCSNPSLNPVPGVTVTLTGTVGGSTTTDGAGNYLLTAGAGGNYTVTPSKAGLPSGSAGITTVDVIAIQRHFLGLGTPLSGCRLAAADVNGAGGVDTVDVVATQRFFLALTTGIANVGKYRFNPLSRTYAGIVSDQTAQNYDALIFGDVASGFVHRPEGEPDIDADESEDLTTQESESLDR